MTPCPHVTDPDLLDWLDENPGMEARCWWDTQREWVANPWSQIGVDTHAEKAQDVQCERADEKH